MKQVIAFLRPNENIGHPEMVWWYFVDFEYEDINVWPPKEQIIVTKQLGKAFVFDEDTMLLRSAMRRIREDHKEVPQMFSLSEKTLFEARLKGE